MGLVRHAAGRTASVAIATVLLGTAAVAAGRGPGTDLRLLEAARQRDRAAVAALVQQKADVNAMQPDGGTPLHWAAHWDDVEIADRLIAAGAHVNATNEYGSTPLWLASVNGSAPMIARLLKAGANPNATLGSGETPLMAAARSGRPEAVTALLAGGADANATESVRGQTALMWAAAERHLAVMRLLVDQGAGVMRTSKAGFTPLMFVAREGDIEAARLLMDRGADVNAAAADGSTALLIATVRGHVELAEYFLDRGANPNAGPGYTPLHWAASIWETSTTFDYKFSAGEWAALQGIPSRDAKLRLIHALIVHGADVNARAAKDPPRFGFTLFGQQQASLVGATPFFLAAVVADVEVMRLLAAAHADPRMPATDLTTPLMVAAGRGRVDNETQIPEARALEAVSLAIQLGNDVNAANNKGETALHAAALAGMDTVVAYLVKHGATVDAKTTDGRTPLAYAEGTVVAMQLVVRPATAGLLRTLGGTSK